MKNLKTLFLSSLSALSALTSVFCAMVATFALSVGDSRLAFASWLGMMWFAVFGVWFLNYAITRGR